jgi:cell wall-associated NlpC family hydrolase
MFDLQYADLIGKPFAHGGRGPAAYDCYGLVTEVQRRLGRKVPDYAYDHTHQQIAYCIEHAIPFWTPCAAEPGAVAAIRVGRYVCHVGTVLPNGKLIHAWESSGGVCIERLQEWERRIVGYYRAP